MVAVVALENGLAQNEEIVLMLCEQKDARRAVVVDIPDIVLVLQFEPYLAHHDVERREVRHVKTIHIRNAIHCFCQLSNSHLV